MSEKFRESERAAAYLADGLNHDFPDAVAEVIQVSRQRPRCVKCPVWDIGPVLQRMCADFPMASVDYHPENPYGFVAEIRCHGEKKSHAMFRRQQKDRPRIIVLLTRINGRDLVVGSRRSEQENSGPGTGE